MFCFAAYIESLWRGTHDAQFMVWDISLFTMDSRSVGRLGGIFFVAAFIKIDGRSAFTGWPAVIASLALFVAASWTNTVIVGIVTVLTVPSIVLALGNVPTRLVVEPYPPRAKCKTSSIQSGRLIPENRIANRHSNADENSDTSALRQMRWRSHVNCGCGPHDGRRSYNGAALSVKDPLLAYFIGKFTLGGKSYSRKCRRGARSR